MENIDIRVEGITKQEFLEANRALSVKKFLIVIGILALCVLSLLITTEVENYAYLALFLVPVPLMLLVHEYSFRRAYQKGPFAEMIMEYSFGVDGWRLNVVDQGEGMVTWADTMAIRTTKSDVLLYVRVRSGRRMVTSSNVIPKRYITSEQLSAMTAWHQASQARVKEAQQTAKAAKKAGK